MVWIRGVPGVGASVAPAVRELLRTRKRAVHWPGLPEQLHEAGVGADCPVARNRGEPPTIDPALETEERAWDSAIGIRRLDVGDGPVQTGLVGEAPHDRLLSLTDQKLRSQAALPYSGIDDGRFARRMPGASSRAPEIFMRPALVEDSMNAIPSGLL